MCKVAVSLVYRRFSDVVYRAALTSAHLRRLLNRFRKEVLSFLVFFSTFTICLYFNVFTDTDTDKVQNSCVVLPIKT